MRLKTNASGNAITYNFRLLFFAIFITLFIITIFQVSAYGASTKTSTAAAQSTTSSGLNFDIDIYNNTTSLYESFNVKKVGLNLDGVPIEAVVPGFIQGGRTLVPIRVISEKLNAEVGYDQETREVRITQAAIDGDVSKNKYMVLKIGSSKAIVNGVEYELPDNIPATLVYYENENRTVVPLRFVSEQLGMTVEWNSKTFSANIKKPKVEKIVSSYSDIILVIDPGHGGSDPGAIKNGVQEKVLNLSVALKLQALLVPTGITVHMIRTDNDTFYTPYERAKISNDLNADIYISIHHNANPKTSISGIQTLYDGSSTAKTAEKTVFAKLIHDKIVKGIGTLDAGMLNNNKYIVTRETNAASALAELGFMTNPDDLTQIQTEDRQQRAAKALYDGILEYSSNRWGLVPIQ